MIPAVVIHCASLGRDISGIRAAVPHLQVYDAKRFPPGDHAGCIAGHQAIVQMARLSGWPAVWVFEDDCEFTPAFAIERWVADATWARNHGYNTITGGCVSTRNPRLVREGLFAVDRFKSTHCIVYHEDVYEIVMKLTTPMDPMLGRLGAKCLVTYPFVAVQRPAFSGILGHHQDYLRSYERESNRLGVLVKAVA